MGEILALLIIQMPEKNLGHNAVITALSRPKRERLADYHDKKKDTKAMSLATHIVLCRD